MVSCPKIGLHIKWDKMGQTNREKIKEKMIKEYLASGLSMRALAKRCGIPSSTLQRWVAESGLKRERVKKGPEMDEGEAAKEIKRLQKELEEARLYNRLLNTIIDIAEEEFEIPIRKKPGAKR